MTKRNTLAKKKHYIEKGAQYKKWSAMIKKERRSKKGTLYRERTAISKNERYVEKERYDGKGALT